MTLLTLPLSVKKTKTPQLKRATGFLNGTP